MEDFMGNFQTVLKTLRKSAELTQDELANKLRVSRSTIGMYESGAREPDYETMENIADFFDVDIDFLFGRTNKASSSTETYYLDKEAREAAEFLHKNPDYKVLFDASRKVKKEDIDFVKKMIDKFSE